MFTNVQKLLIREASLASACLDSGLTDISKYSISQTGYFYTALFSFCIGIERISKLILIYEYQLKNNKALPDNTYIKSFSHDINKLFQEINRIHDENNLNLSERINIQNDSIFKEIILILTDFAKGSRYYNLDQITGKQLFSSEPLKLWDERVAVEIIKRHYEEPEVKLNNNFYDTFGSSFIILHTAEDGSSINDLKTLVNHGNQVPIKQQYSKYYLYTLANYVSKVLTELEYQGNFFPCLREFFTQFVYAGTKEEVLARRDWREL